MLIKKYSTFILLLMLCFMPGCSEDIILSPAPINPTHPKLLLVPQQYSTIQSAIDSASVNDTILVSPGTYYENINFSGKNIIIKSSGTAENTIIDGSQPVDPNNSSVVKFVTAEDSITAILDGFTITGGSGSWSWPGKVGGGIWIENAQAIVKNCIIQNNSGPTKGGGVYCGYEIGTNLNSSIMSNCVITDNDALAGGSGIHIKFIGSMKIDHCTIANNNIMLETTAQASSSFFSNSIIWLATTTLTYGTPEFNYCDIQGGWTSGVGNIDSDPIFCNSRLGNYNLASNSPCIGAGVNGTNIGALGTCGQDYSRFDYPLEIGTTWNYSYSYTYFHLGDWSYRKGIHYWTVVDSSEFDGDFVRFKIKSVNDDTTANYYNPTPQHIIDSTFFFIDVSTDAVIVRPPSRLGAVQDNIQGYFSGNDSIQIGGRTYQEKIGLTRMYHENATNTHYTELQQLIEYIGKCK